MSTTASRYSLATEFCYTLFRTGSTRHSFAKNYLWEKDERDDDVRRACVYSMIPSPYR